MDPLLSAAYALFRICACFAVIALASRRRWPLEAALLLSGFVLALLSGFSPLKWAETAAGSLGDPGMLSLLFSLMSILLLSGIMEKSGQSHRLVLGVEAAIKSTKARLVFFPALIGLFPVPGGAIFSCPMIEETSRHLELSGEDKTLLNYWFRHIWELVWPLYPGFILYCGLSEFSPLTAVTHNWPSWVASIAAGWLLYLRGNPALERESARGVPPADGEAGGEDGQQAERAGVWLECLPLLAGLGGAFGLRLLYPDLASGFAFAAGFGLGIVVCLAQNRLSPAALGSVLLSRKSRSILALVIAIFIFKGILEQSGTMQALGSLTRNPVTLFLACTLLPLAAGMLTGVLVALVGISFPIILAMLQQADLWADRLPWLTLALMFGNIGQMLSPVHVCLVVSCRFFEVGLGGIMRRLCLPCLILAGTALSWFALLVFFQKG